MKPIVDLLIVSYSRDVPWFRQSLQVLAKNLTGIRQIHLVCPTQDRPLFEQVKAETGIPVRIHPVPDWPGAGYYWQQFVKISADRYSDAPFICHMDSDTFMRPADISEFFVDGKPGWLWTPFNELPENARVWRAPTERASGLSCENDFMCGFPFILDRRTYAVCRKHLEKASGRTVEQYIREAKPVDGGPPGFSEFNFMGRVAWEKQRPLYHWIERNRQEWPPGFHKIKQFWSHAELADCMPEIQQILHGGDTPQIRTTRMGHWIISNDTHISKWVEQSDRLDHDRYVLDRLCRFIKPGDTVVDVGAFIGDHTIAYARSTHGIDSGRVLAFEPNPVPFECLRRNMHGLAHVQCINAGLSSKEGEMSIATDPNAGASHLTAGRGIPVKTLDSYKLDRLDFLKIDAEGMELEILKGGRATIRRCRPTMYVEVNRGALERQGTTADALLTYIRGLGYTITGELPGEQFDVLCRPAEAAQQKVVLVLGVSHREVHLARMWLRWVAHLCRQPGGDNNQYTLIIFVNRRTSDEQCRSMLNEIGHAREGMFQTLLAAPDDEQEAGYPGSASHLFVRALEYVEKTFPGAATLWCEADTVPVRPTWLQEIVDEYRACGKPFMGGQAGEGEYRHMTGNAVYPHDWRALAPLLLESYSSTRPSNYWPNGFGDPWDVYARSQVMPNMYLCKTIQQIWRPGWFADASRILPETALFHQCKDGSLIKVLAERYPGFTQPSPQHGFTLSGRATKVDVHGREVAFTPTSFLAGLGWISFRVPADYCEELELLWLAGQKIGVEAVPVEEARRAIAGARGSRLPSPPVNALKV